MRALGAALICVMAFGCGKSESKSKKRPAKRNLPADVQHLVDKLGDKAEVGKALDGLEKLNNPAAIAPLAEAWQKNRDGQFLRAIINIAYDEKTATLAAQAIPLLINVARAVNVAKPLSRVVDQAAHAMTALRHAKSPKALIALVEVCRYPAKSSYAQRATVVACDALVEYPGDPSYQAMIAALARGITTKSTKLTSAAAFALGRLGDKRALVPLVKAMYIAPKSFGAVRTALVALGPSVVPKMMAIFAGVDDDINALAKKVKLSTPSMRHQAALMLGDLYVKKAVPHLLKELEQKPPAAQAHHDAIFVALTQIAEPAAAKPLLAYALDTSRQNKLRVSAIGAYGLLAPSTKELPRLLAWLAREKDGSLRNILTATAAQLVRDQRGLSALLRALPKKTKVRRSATVVAAMGALCGNDSNCYLTQVESLPADFSARISKLAGVSLTPADVARRKPLADVRALTDVVKLRAKDPSQLPTLMRLLATAAPVIHQQLLYAIVHISPRPCPKCVKRLDQLLVETRRMHPQIRQSIRVLRNYLGWAK